ncbi:MAG: hypothetical protein QNJ78_07345 [Gammaproteobacteria bacterium]|nr:hypothetical protein [Gammaproteobacteria bacterium]
MNLKKSLQQTLLYLLFAMFTIGSSSLLADSDDDHGGGNEDQGGGGGGSRDRDALTADFVAIPPTKGKGDGQYFELGGGSIDQVLNADVRLALEKLDADGNTLKVLNTHLGITVDNYKEAVITVFIGTDEDGDGTCLTEGPTSICVLVGGGDDLEVNSDGILHAAWAMALREEDDNLLGSGTCYTDFESTEVIPQLDEDGNMTSVVFEITGGEEAMPEIEEDDGTMVGFSWRDPDVPNNECGADTSCEVIPIMMGVWDD